jgi:sugar lactone lactonase YvrE
MLRALYIVSVFFCFTAALPVSAQLISTVAGNGGSGFSGDGGPATAAQISGEAIATDAAGNTYIADYYNYRIRKINAAGIITTIAGNGTPGFSGDGGPATAAEINTPFGLAVDRTGNVYFSDIYTRRVRKINAAGIISTFAGNGVLGSSGDGGPATAASLWAPTSLAADTSGNIYICDYSANVVRKVNTAGVISTFAGIGASGFSGDGGPAVAAWLSSPNWVSAGRSGNVYISEMGNKRIRKVSPSGIISTFAGVGIWGFSGDGGAAASALVFEPRGMAEDTAGNVYFADGGNNRIRKVNTSGIINTVAGTGASGFSDDGTTAPLATFYQLAGVALNCFGDLLVAEFGNRRIRKIGYSTGTIVGANFACMGTPITMADTPAGIAGTWSSGTISVATIASSGVVTPVAPGTTTITYSVGFACGTATTTKVVTVIALPVAGTITGLDTLCAATTTLLTNSAGLGAWSSSVASVAIVSASGVVTGVSGGTSNISYIVTNSCGTVHATKTVTVFPLPNAGTITGGSDVCEGQTLALSNAAAGGVWSSGSSNATVSASGVVTGITNGIAPISYTVNNNCGTASAVAPIYVKPLSVCVVGMGSFGEAIDFKVYPNPSRGAITVNLPQTAEQVTIIITSLLGHTIYQSTANKSEFDIILPETASGNYIMKAQIGNEVYRKIITIIK